MNKDNKKFETFHESFIMLLKAMKLYHRVEKKIADDSFLQYYIETITTGDISFRLFARFLSSVPIPIKVFITPQQINFFQTNLNGIIIELFKEEIINYIKENNLEGDFLELLNKSKQFKKESKEASIEEYFNYMQRHNIELTNFFFERENIKISNKDRIFWSFASYDFYNHVLKWL